MDPQYKLGITRPLTRRDYFIGCVLQTLVRTHASSGSSSRKQMVKRAIEIADEVERQLNGGE